MQIDGVGIRRTIAAKAIADVAEAVRSLDDQSAIFPLGGGTALDYGLPPSRPGVAIDVTGLTSVDDYPSEDMTITVEAGIRIAELAHILAAKGQMLPIDAADADRATLGGVIATNASGPRRFGYGTVRDYVLGIDVIDPAGRRIHGGGRVVKNVAGYDFMKMHTGALGTLGIIVQATLKLRPIAESRAFIFSSLAADHIEPVLERLSRSRTRPVAIELANQSVAKGLSLDLDQRQPWVLILLFEESAPATLWQLEQIQKELGEFGIKANAGTNPEAYSRILDHLVQWPATIETPVVFKANLLPGKVAEFCRLAEAQTPGIALAAHAGSGIVHGGVAVGALEELAIDLAVLRSAAFEAEGNLVLIRCPTEWKQSLAVWGRPHSSWSLMKRLKVKLDPADRLNPGRFVTAASG